MSVFQNTYPLSDFKVQKENRRFESFAIEK